MAKCIPSSISSLDNATNGEKRVFNLLKQNLPDEDIVYYEARVNNKYADFIVVSPRFGILVLEVKDWRTSNITKVDGRNFRFDNTFRQENVLNPYEQVKGYMYEVCDILKSNNVLKHSSGNHYGKLKFPLAAGVVFTNIKRNQFNNSKMKGTIDSNVILFQDDLIKIEKNPINNHEFLIEKLNNMFTIDFNFEPITEGMINKIRGSLFPETVLDMNANVFKVMDLEQEQVAKGLGEGHRVIRGVAGSGKSIILICRARYLAEKYPNIRILVLCYNKSFASYLRQKLNYENIETTHFHSWVNKLNREILFGRKPVYEDYDTKSVCLRLIENNDENYKYDAILIDEGQDFHESWLRLIVNRLKKGENGNLLLVSDGAQNLYNRKYSFLDVGIQARGRSKVFRKNYRNTNNILKFAESYIEGATDSLDKEFENDFIIETDEILRGGEAVDIFKYSSNSEQEMFIVNTIKNLLSIYLEEDICILVSTKTLIKEYIDKLTKHGINCNNLREEKSIIPNMLNISTIHSAKGFEFKVVFLIGINDYMFNLLDNNENINQLIYVGMTRAMDKLYVSCEKGSQMCKLIDNGIKKIYDNPEENNKSIVNLI